MDHAEERGELRGLARIQIHVFLWRVKRAVRCVGRDVGEERFVFRRALTDEALGLGEEHIGAESLGGNHAAVVIVTAIEVGVVPEIRRLADSAAAVAIDLGESAVFGTIWEIIAEMPFAKKPGGIAGVLEHLSERDLVLAQHRAAVHRVPDAGAIRPAPREQRRARG